MIDEDKMYYTYEEYTQIETVKKKIQELEKVTNNKINVILKQDAKDNDDAIRIYNSLKKINIELEDDIKILNDSIKDLGTSLFENNNRIAIPNYLSRWFEYNKNINPEDCKYFIVKDSRMLLQKVEYDSTSEDCLLEDMTRNSSVTVSMGKFKPTEPKGHQFRLPKDEVIPLTKIKEPTLITLRDLFHTDGEFWPTVRRIHSFASNPWSGIINSFVDNSIYCPRTAFGQMKHTWIMIQGSDELDALLNIKR